MEKSADKTGCSFSQDLMTSLGLGGSLYHEHHEW